MKLCKIFENESFSEAQYRTLIVTGAQKDTPPQIPMFSGISIRRRAPKVTLEESIITAAAGIAKADTVASPQTPNSPRAQSPLSVSGKQLKIGVKVIFNYRH